MLREFKEWEGEMLLMVWDGFIEEEMRNKRRKREEVEFLKINNWKNGGLFVKYGKEECFVCGSI